MTTQENVIPIEKDVLPEGNKPTLEVIRPTEEKPSDGLSISVIEKSKYDEVFLEDFKKFIEIDKLKISDWVKDNLISPAVKKIFNGDIEGGTSLLERKAMMEPESAFPIQTAQNIIDLAKIYKEEHQDKLGQWKQADIDEKVKVKKRIPAKPIKKDSSSAYKDLEPSPKEMRGFEMKHLGLQSGALDEILRVQDDYEKITDSRAEKILSRFIEGIAKKQEESSKSISFTDPNNIIKALKGISKKYELPVESIKVNEVDEKTKLMILELINKKTIKSQITGQISKHIDDIISNLDDVEKRVIVSHLIKLRQTERAIGANKKDKQPKKVEEKIPEKIENKEETPSDKIARLNKEIEQLKQEAGKIKEQISALK